VFLKAGATGLIPLEETGAEREGDLRKLFPVGSDVEVMVLEVEPASRRIRLSRKAIRDATERQEARDYAAGQNAAEAQAGGFGSLAETLRKAMEKRGK
jgi:ribosomal protein S1